MTFEHSRIKTQKTERKHFCCNPTHVLCISSTLSSFETVKAITLLEEKKSLKQF